jgi:hypothetical protein
MSRCHTSLMCCGIGNGVVFRHDEFIVAVCPGVIVGFLSCCIWNVLFDEDLRNFLKPGSFL